MVHQIKENNETIDINFYINYAQDSHVTDNNAPIGDTGEGEIEKSTKEQLLEAVIFISFLAVVFLGLEIIKPEKE
jgi:hypothetical protein